MILAISSDGPDVHDNVGSKLGTARYMVFFNSESGNMEIEPNPGITGQRGAGMQAVVLALSKDASVIVTGYCSPAIKGQLKANGIEVITGISGTVAEVIDKYRQGELLKETTPDTKWHGIDKNGLLQALKNSCRQFATLLPILVGVLLLVGLFTAFIGKDVLTSIFTENAFLDTLWGVCFGSILAGNPINSYVIGGELLKYNVSLFAVTALIVTWVTVGLVQLPAEMTALGKKFALLRNSLSILVSIPIAIVVVVIVNLIHG